MAFEPLGLLWGNDARAAVAAGAARPLSGGPAAFTLVRHDGRVVPVCDVAPEALHHLSVAVPDWAGLGCEPLVMGVLNVTPDSFSDGGRYHSANQAIVAGEQMLADGADVLDIGGESTRPGSTPISEAEEQARILPVVAALAGQGAVLSVDTRNAETMRRALDAGARIVNDVTALTHDAAALPLVAARGCPVVLMHMRGTPATMASLAVYDNVGADVLAELRARVDAAVAAGVRTADIMIDPGFGFAKSAAHNLELMQRLPLLLGMGRPLLVGISRKATIGALSGEPDPGRRLGGSVAAALHALNRGARMVRVHDVAATVQAMRVWRGLMAASAG